VASPLVKAVGIGELIEAKIKKSEEKLIFKGNQWQRPLKVKSGESESAAPQKKMTGQLGTLSQKSENS